MSKPMSDEARADYLEQIIRGMRANLQCDHPLNSRLSGGPYRDAQKQARSARKALDRAGLLDAALAEANAKIRQDTLDHYRREIASCERAIAEAESEIASYRKRIEKARNEAALLAEES